jgi:hypothetical protein
MPYNKYRVSNKADRTLDGIVFASKLEMNRYSFLMLMQKSKKIKNLELQPPFILCDSFYVRGKKHRGLKFTADFAYDRVSDNQHIIEDCKGYPSRDYIVRLAWFLSKGLKLEFHEIKDANEIGGIEIDKGVK